VYKIELYFTESTPRCNHSFQNVAGREDKVGLLRQNGRCHRKIFSDRKGWVGGENSAHWLEVKNLRPVRRQIEVKPLFGQIRAKAFVSFRAEPVAHGPVVFGKLRHG
jgi:hypothetical protein